MAASIILLHSLNATSSMSTPAAALLTSPGKNSTSMRSQAGNSNYKGQEVYDDIAKDIKRTESCDFDDFLRYFLSLCLEGAEKTEFEELQTKIETFQQQRYKSANEDDTNLTTTPQGERTASSEETETTEKRNQLMKRIFDRCLNDVLPVANTPAIKNELLKFATSINNDKETSRYEPYTDLSNKAFELLSSKNFYALRSEATHHLRTCRADPKSIESTFSEMPGSLERKPDLVRTSLAVAQDVHTPVNGRHTFGGKPNKKFTWPQVLSCEEMKAFKTSKQSQRTSKQARDVTAVSIFKTERQVTVDYKDIPPEEVVDVEDVGVAEVPTPSAQSSAGLKNGQIEAITKSGSKRSRSDSTLPTANSNKKAKSIRVAAANVQLATYAMEMLSFSPGVHHVINTLIIDDLLWVWYYDRQGIIRSNGISIIADFPRFLVLLLAFQRFTLEDWGVIPCLNAQALSHLGIAEALQGFTGPIHSLSPNTNLLSEMKFKLEGDHFSRSRKGKVEGKELQGLVCISRDMYLSPQPHCLAGRATAVLKATCGEIKLACKIYNSEVQRANEGDTITLVRAIAEKKDPEGSMLDHLPGLYFDGDIKGCTTIRVRSVLGVSAKGYRTLRVLILPELEILSRQDGPSFTKAWLDGVKCHAFLWKHGVEHGDPSLWNVMYNSTKKCGVLVDFDLSIIQWLPRVPGTDRTGTIPFMATTLLKQEYWDGKVIRIYHHELEAFFWILPFVFLAYKNGKRDPKVTLISSWITSDITTCRDKKVTFLQDYATHVPNIQPGFKDYRHLFLGVCNAMQSLQRKQLDRVTALLDAGLPLGQDEIQIQEEDSKYLWTAFISNLEKYHLSLPSLKLLSFVEELRKHNPVHNNEADRSALFEEVKQIYKAIVPS